MLWMSEAEVGSRRARRGSPINPLLDCAVVTLGTVFCLGPQGGTSHSHPAVAAGASGKERAMLPMIEPILGLGESRAGTQREA